MGQSYDQHEFTTNPPSHESASLDCCQIHGWFVGLIIPHNQLLRFGRKPQTGRSMVRVPSDIGETPIPEARSPRKFGLSTSPGALLTMSLKCVTSPVSLSDLAVWA